MARITPKLDMKVLRACMIKGGAKQHEIDALFPDAKFHPDKAFDYDYFIKGLTDKEISLANRKRHLILDSNRLKALDDDIKLRESQGVTVREIAESQTTEGFENIKGSSQNLESLTNAIKNDFISQLGDFVQHFTPTIGKLGKDLLAPIHRKGRVNQRDPLPRAIMEEVNGQSSGNPLAKSFGKSVSEVFENLRLRWNSVGGSMKEFLNYFPQTHDKNMLTRKGFTEWDRSIRAGLDFKKSDIDPTKDLRWLYDAILEKDKVDIDTGGGGGGKKGRFVDSIDKERRLYFNSVDDQLKYNDEFGTGDIIGTIYNHIDTMSKAIAYVEKFGTDAHTNFDKVMNMLETKQRNKSIDLAESGKKDIKHKGSVTSMARIHRDLILGMQKVDNKGFATFMSNFRSLIVSSLAGKIALSQMTDPLYSQLRALQFGLKTNRAMRISHEIVYDIFTNNADVKGAPRMGYINEADIGLFDRMVGVDREISMVSPWVRDLSQFMFRAGTVTHLTKTSQIKAARELNYGLTDFASKSYNDLPINLQKSLGKHAIGESDWDIIRRSLSKHGGFDEIDPYKMSMDVRTKFNGMIVSEVRKFTPMPSVRQQAYFRSSPAGSVTGELMRTLGVFKSFPLSVIDSFIRPMLRNSATKGDRWLTAAYVFGALPIMGSISVMAKMLVDGKLPPNPLEDTDMFIKVYMAGLLQGGGLGIFGDFIFGQENRFNNSIHSTILGPVFSRTSDTKKSIQGMFSGVIEGDEEKFRKNMGSLFSLSYRVAASPLGLWYTGALSNTTIHNPMRNIIDPTYSDRMRRNLKRQERSGAISGTFFDTHQLTE